jgi:hypothetical protein
VIKTGENRCGDKAVANAMAESHRYEVGRIRNAGTAARMRTPVIVAIVIPNQQANRFRTVGERRQTSPGGRSGRGLRPRRRAGSLSADESPGVTMLSDASMAIVYGAKILSGG